MAEVKKLTYAGVGVDYDAMDPFKRACQLAGLATAKAMNRFGLEEVGASRGESAYLARGTHGDLAHVQEGLGTKNLVADAMYELTGDCYYDSIAQDVVAMIVNDLITVGALPMMVAMHLAVGSSDWFEETQRWRALISGWAKACEMARCTWSCGETPTLLVLMARPSARSRGTDRRSTVRESATKMPSSSSRAPASTPTESPWLARSPTRCPKAT
jgi:phosphoribosylformylglycinamidine cyclo-ligase